MALAPPSAWASQAREVQAANVTLVVSHYAARPGAVVEHHAEVESALRANLANPLFGQLVVLFEEAANVTCAVFSRRLLLAAFPHRTEEAAASAKLDCRPQRTQPTYFEIFEFVSTAALRPLVVLANADVVFDATLAQLPPLGRGDVHVLTVNARASPRAKRWATRKQDEKDLRCPMPAAELATGKEWVRMLGHNEWRPSGGTLADWKLFNTSVLSWDAYAMRPPLPGFDADPSSTHGLGLRAALDFYMNEINAENEAACALEVFGGATVHAPCLLVRLRHLHRAPKTHRNATHALRRRLGTRSPCYRRIMARTGHGPRPQDWRAAYARDPCEYADAAGESFQPSFVVAPGFCPGARGPRPESV